MAATSDNSSNSKGFSLTKPGAKEYLIIGGVALAAGLLYFWWKNKQAAASTAADTGTGTGSGPSTPTGLSTGQLWSWISDHNSSTTTTSTTPPTTTAAGTATVPTVTGKRGEDAKDAITAAGFKPLQTPATTPKGKTTKVTSQNPKGGSKAAKGSDVAYAVSVT
jgi:hypothetical protein